MISDERAGRDLLSQCPADDLAARFRRDLRRAADPLGLRITLTPVWIVEPYADRHACWGCGLAPEGQERTLGGCRLCWWCSELLDVDKANQRRERERPTGRIRRHTVRSGTVRS